MINLRKELNKILKSIHPNITVDGKSKSRVHYENALDDTPFPYIVYNLPNSFTNEDQDIFNLDIDIWDMPEGGDTTIIETLTSKIWKHFHKLYYIDNNIQFSTYRMNKLNVEDDDKRIKRRKLIFQLRYYDREV